MAPWSSEPWGELSAIDALAGFCHCSMVIHMHRVCVYVALVPPLMCQVQENHPHPY